jgi:hypothetical protein
MFPLGVEGLVQAMLICEEDTGAVVGAWTPSGAPSAVEKVTEELFLQPAEVQASITTEYCVKGLRPVKVTSPSAKVTVAKELFRKIAY